MPNAREIKGTLKGLKDGKLAIEVLHNGFKPDGFKIELVTLGFDITPKFISDWIERDSVGILVIDDKAVQVKRSVGISGQETSYPSDL